MLESQLKANYLNIHGLVDQIQSWIVDPPPAIVWYSVLNRSFLVATFIHEEIGISSHLNHMALSVVSARLNLSKHHRVFVNLSLDKTSYHNLHSVAVMIALS